MADVRAEQVIQKHHEYKGGAYVEVIYDRAANEYPKAMYHRDYVHNKAEGREYPETAHAVVVNSKEEEQALGEGWFPSLQAAGQVTAPSVEQMKARAQAKPKDEKKK